MTKRAGGRALENVRRGGQALFWWCSALAFHLLARFFGTLLQFFLQFLLLRLEHLGVRGRPFIGLQEAVARGVGERQREGDGRGGKVDRLDLEYLAFLELADEIRRRLVIGHAAVGKAGEEGGRDGLRYIPGRKCS